MAPDRLHVVTLAVLFGLSLAAQGQNSRVEQAREVRRLDLNTTPNGQRATAVRPGPGQQGEIEDFGVQQLLQERPRQTPFSAFADVSAFVTNNVGLTRHDPKTDSFLVATFGLNYRQPLPYGLRLDLGASIAAFRYNRFPRLGFNDLELGASLNYHTGLLGGLDLSAGYTFTDLSNRRARSFFTNNAIDLSVQKSMKLADAHSIYGGLAAEIAFADPRFSERNEYSAFLGYSLQATSKWSADVIYRYSFYDYAEGDRGDHHQTVSLNTRYRFTPYLSLNGTAYWVFNNSNDPVFNYNAGNLGGGVSVKLTF